MQFLETVFYFLVTLGVLVFVHELGHFLMAKLTGMRVERFSIGFPPRAFGKQIGETDYCISWIPIGGYVKIAGMIDESFDTEHLSHDPQPYEFRAKPLWARMLVISGGVLMNILLAVAIFWGINYHQGRVIRQTTEIGYVVPGSAAATAGLAAGDQVLRINETPITHWDQILSEMYIKTMGNDVTMVVRRAGQEVALPFPRQSIPDPSQSGFGILPPQTEIVVNTVEPGMPADQLGLKPLDVLLTLHGEPLHTDLRVKELVKQNAGKPLEVQWKRGSEIMKGSTTPTEDGRIGIGFGLRYNGPIQRVDYSLAESFAQGMKDIVSVSGLFLSQVWQIITGKVAFAQSVGGPIRIAQMATQTAELGILALLGFMALLSISLAILNFLPFPALDGGHMVFLVYEGIFRKEVPVKLRMGLQRIGFILLLVFMAFVVYNDIMHF
jgi:regulator of sigma E protease